MTKCAQCGKEIEANAPLTIEGKPFCDGSCYDTWIKNGKKTQGQTITKTKDAGKNTKTALTSILIAMIAAASGPLISHYLDGDFSSLVHYTSTEGRYSVSLPAKPKTQDVTGNTAKGPVLIHMVNSQAKRYAVTVSYCDYPDSIITGLADKTLLDNVRAGYIRGISGQLLSELLIQINGFPGRELRCEGPRKEIYRSKFLLVRPRLYQLILQAAASDVDDKKANDIMDSFNISK